VLPIVVALVFAAVNRWRPPSKEDDGPPFCLGWLLALAYAGLYSHLALDLLNNYGVRVLAPLDLAVVLRRRGVHRRSLALAHPGVSVWFARRHRAVAARWALVAAVGYIALMTISARVARADVVDAWRRAEGAPPAALMVGPMPVTPFARGGDRGRGRPYASGLFTWWPRAVRSTGRSRRTTGRPRAERRGRRRPTSAAFWCVAIPVLDDRAGANAVRSSPCATPVSAGAWAFPTPSSSQSSGS
jgi:hypothetical protein